MSSTNNIQNYLSNVFRPTFLYASGSTIPFQIKLNMSNINNITADSVTAGTLGVGDVNGNVYLGSNAGNSILSLQNSSNNVAVGTLAGTSNSNTQQSIFIGYAAGTNVSDVSDTIAIGPQSLVGGSKNIYIGARTGSVLGSNNVFIGNDLDFGPRSNKLYIGRDSNTVVVSADFQTERVGVLTTDPSYSIHLNDYTYVQNGLGINADPAEHTFNVNGDFYVQNGYGYFTFDNDSNGDTLVEFGSTTGTATVNVCGNLFVSGAVNISGGINQNFVTASTITATTLLDVSTGLARISNLEVSNVRVDNSLVVNAPATITGQTTLSTTNITGTTTITGPLTVSNATQFQNNVTVAGTSTFSNNVIVSNGNLNVSGGNAAVTGTLNVSGITQLIDICGSSLAVTGDLRAGGTIYGTVAGSITTSSLSLPGTLTVGGDTSLNALNVSGVSIFYSPLNVSGANASIRGDLSVTGLTQFSGVTRLLGDASFNGTTTVTGSLNVFGVSTFSNYVGVSNVSNSFHAFAIQQDACATAGVYSAGYAFGDSFNNGQLIVSSRSSNNRRLVLGYSQLDDAGVIQSVWQNTRPRPLLLNPGRVGTGVGYVAIGYVPPVAFFSNGPIMLTISGAAHIDGGRAGALGVSQSRLVLGPASSSTNYDYCSLIQSTQNTPGNFGSELSFWTHSSATNGADPLRAVTIDSNQRVGINKQFPIAPLDVSAAVSVFNGGSGTSTTRLALGPCVSVGDYDQCSLIQSSNTAGNATSELSFWTHATTSNNAEPVRAMTITSGQQVGIGTTTPGATLDVNGSGRFTSLTVNGIAGNLVRTVEVTTAGSSNVIAPTTSGNYIAHVTLIGGGGGGGGGGFNATDCGGGGGGGSGAVTTFETLVSAGQSIAFTVGAGGNGGTAGGGAGGVGTAGGSTTLGKLSAAGGSGGAQGFATFTTGVGGAGGAGGLFGGGGGKGSDTGGAGGNGTLVNGSSGISGGLGNAGYGGSITGPSGTTGSATGGWGGGEPQYAGQGGSIGGGAGSSGIRYGAGGGGGGAIPAGPAGAGGSGAPGAVIIRFFAI